MRQNGNKRVYISKTFWYVHRMRSLNKNWMTNVGVTQTWAYLNWPRWLSKLLPIKCDMTVCFSQGNGTFVFTRRFRQVVKIRVTYFNEAKLPLIKNYSNSQILTDWCWAPITQLNGQRQIITQFQCRNIQGNCTEKSKTKIREMFPKL